MEQKVYLELPAFTGRNVPISELAKAMGKDAQYIRLALQQGLLKFGIAMKKENSSEFNYYCPDKKFGKKLVTLRLLNMCEKEVKFYTVSEMKNDTSFLSNREIELVKNLIHGNKVSLLSGGSKTGKSTIALALAECVSMGNPFLRFPTNKKSVLYISIDNEDDLIQERIHKMEMQDNESLIFCFDKSIVLGNGVDPCESELDLFEVIRQAQERIPNLGLVILDLLDNIRSLTERNEYSNAKSAEDINKLKDIASFLEVHIIALNHDTKSGIGNGYSSSKGGVELVGTINGSYLHLVRTKINDTNAILEVGVRNIPENRLSLLLNTEKLKYELQDTPIEDFPYEIGIIRNYLIKTGSCELSLSELLSQAKLTIAANQCSRLLKKYQAEF